MTRRAWHFSRWRLAESPPSVSFITCITLPMESLTTIQIYLAKEVIRAAGDVGLRIALQRVAYVRSGFKTEPNPRQARFIENDADKYLKNVESLCGVVNRGVTAIDNTLPDGRVSATAWVGVAPHSVRAVPLGYLKQVIGYANDRDLKIHMHVAEQPAEVSACVEEYGRTPIALLENEGLLNDRFTAVHAIHVTPKAISSFAQNGCDGLRVPDDRTKSW
jgi:formimidoylglutamate deiminase